MDAKITDNGGETSMMTKRYLRNLKVLHHKIPSKYNRWEKTETLHEKKLADTTLTK